VSRPLKIICVGAGPGGLYFALLMKRADPTHEVVVIERNRADDTFGFGVVFSDATMAGIADADSEAYAAIAQHLVHWDDIAVYYGGEVLRSTGHGFSGMSRHTLLRVLQDQARDAGVTLEFEREMNALDDFEGADLIVGADGVNSTVRRLLGSQVQVSTDTRPNRFVWLGTDKPFPEFTFYFRTDAHGLWRVHAYQYAPDRSTFIVECRDETWRAAGLDRADEAATVAFLEALFEQELAGHRLIANKSVWRQFPTIRVKPWFAGHVVLLGDAAHTAHFSVGSGTRMAMEDAVALRNALVRAPVAEALAAFEAARRPQIESLQRAAQASLQWFEETERYVQLPPLQFAFTLLTRSLRITHEDMRKRDPAFLAQVDRFVADEAARQVTGTVGNAPARVPPPMFTPFRLRDLVIPNRVVVSPMCQYVADDDGTVGDWHMVHLGSRALGGAGLVMAEMTDVSRDARRALQSQPAFAFRRNGHRLPLLHVVSPP
jgi:anthraniloyl-CoA monooxygenase